MSEEHAVTMVAVSDDGKSRCTITGEAGYSLDRPMYQLCVLTEEAQVKLVKAICDEMERRWPKP